MKEIGPISDNCDMKMVSFWVAPMGETRVRPIVGRAFYKHLLQAYNNQTLTSDEEELVGMMQKVIAWRSAAQSVYSVSRPLKNIGVQRMRSENSDGVDTSDIVLGMDHYDQVAGGYQRDLVLFLKENKSKYPELTAANNKDNEALKGCEGDTTDGGMNDFFMVS